MNLAFRDWLITKQEDFTKYVEEKKSITHVQVLFGGRAYYFSHLMHEIIDKDAVIKVISFKDQRKLDPDSESSWKINFLGYNPYDYNENESFSPMTEEEKNNYPFVSKEEYIARKGIDHFITNILVIGEGAAASGTTLEHTLNEIFGTLKEYKKLLPEKVYIYVNFCSTLAILKAKNICDKFHVKLDFTCMGSAIKVKQEGIFPGLRYTDLPQLDEESVTYQILRMSNPPTDFSGKLVPNRCSCGDVGDSLDNAYHYYMMLILENLLLGIPLDLDKIPDNPKGLMEYWNDQKCLVDLYKIVDEIQTEHHIELKDYFGTPIQTVLYRQLFGTKKDNFFLNLEEVLR